MGHWETRRQEIAEEPKRTHRSEGSQIVLCFFFQLDFLLQPGQNRQKDKQLWGRGDRDGEPTVERTVQTDRGLIRGWAQNTGRRPACWVETRGPEKEWQKPCHSGRGEEVSQSLP